MNLVGKRFGRLIVVSKTDKRSFGHVVWRCRCDCGKYNDVLTGNLTDGNTKSCGCFQKERIKELNAGNNYAFKHGYTAGHSILGLYVVWKGMKQRCYNPKTPDYKYYGGKGVSVCPEWKNDYLAFRNWASANGYEQGLSIDRINNDGNYEPSNCQFITRSENTKKAHRERRNYDCPKP
jgi:hypothetical protein